MFSTKLNNSWFNQRCLSNQVHIYLIQPSHLFEPTWICCFKL